MLFLRYSRKHADGYIWCDCNLCLSFVPNATAVTKLYCFQCMLLTSEEVISKRRRHLQKSPIQILKRPFKFELVKIYLQSIWNVLDLEDIFALWWLTYARLLKMNGLLNWQFIFDGSKWIISTAIHFSQIRQLTHEICDCIITVSLYKRYTHLQYTGYRKQLNKKIVYCAVKAQNGWFFIIMQ